MEEDDMYSSTRNMVSLQKTLQEQSKVDAGRQSTFVTKDTNLFTPYQFNKKNKNDSKNDSKNDDDQYTDVDGMEMEKEKKKHGWEKMIKESNGKTYYWNWDLSETTWERPVDYSTDEDANIETSNQATTFKKKQKQKEKVKQKNAPIATPLTDLGLLRYALSRPKSTPIPTPAPTPTSVPTSVPASVPTVIPKRRPVIHLHTNTASTSKITVMSKPITMNNYRNKKNGMVTVQLHLLGVGNAKEIEIETKWKVMAEQKMNNLGSSVDQKEIQPSPGSGGVKKRFQRIFLNDDEKYRKHEKKNNHNRNVTFDMDDFYEVARYKR